MPFSNTHPALAQALEAQGYLEPTAVQAAVIEAPAGADLLVSAQTGSGKTVAFGLAAAGDLMGEAPTFGPAAAPLCLVIAPTRELALQVSNELGWLYAATKAQVVTCVGGMDARREQRALAAGAHIVVGTPGRLRDHLERGNLDLSALRVVVLDEADEMLDLGFREDLEEILDSTPAERRTLLFSATIAREIAALAKRYQRDAIRIDTIRRDEPHADIEYRVVRIAPNEIEHAVVNVLRFFEAPAALIFCATREAVRHLYGSLRERGFSAVALSGELSQKERADALQALRNGQARACVATDVAARGLDLPELSLVIHAELPQNKAALLHRSGRTGRAGRKGVSVLLTPYPKRRRVELLLASAQIDAIWSGPPSADEVRERDQVRLLEDPVLQEGPSEDELGLAQRLLEACSPEQLAAAVIRLQRRRLPEPEEVYDDGQGAAHSPAQGPRAPDRGYQPSLSGGPSSAEGGAWFRMAVGRQNNADPKWLIPLICRLGHVTKKDIGEIRISDRETRFQIAPGAEPRFREAIQGAAREGDIEVHPADAPGPKAARPPSRPRPARGGPPGKPPSGKPPHKPPYAGQPAYSGKPASGKPPKRGRRANSDR